VIFLCALFLFVNVSLLCTLVVHYHHIVVCSWCSSMSLSAMLHALVVHQHLLVVCSCCLSVSPYCAILMFIGVFLLCALVAHQCIVAMHSCCSSTSCCYALLLFIGISLMCILHACRQLLAAHLLTHRCFKSMYFIDPLVFFITSLLFAPIVH